MSALDKGTVLDLQRQLAECDEHYLCGTKLTPAAARRPRAQFLITEFRRLRWRERHSGPARQA
jgi:hypothetical protein